MPSFHAMSILSMVIVMMIAMLESVGDVYAAGEIVKKPVGSNEITRALRADGIATILGGLFNSFPYTCFAQNVGLVRLTGIRSRWVVAAAAVIMMLLGCLPKLAAMMACIPLPVMGGAALAMFGAVAVVGIQALGQVNFEHQGNVAVVGTSLGLGMLIVAQPHIADHFPAWMKIIFGSGITLGAAATIMLNLIFNRRTPSSLSVETELWNVAVQIGQDPNRLEADPVSALARRRV
jgi:xanthine/uracil permease